MVLPTLTRGIAFRDDMMTSSQWTPTNPPSGTLSLASDGDVLTATAAFGAGTSLNDTCSFTVSIPSFSMVTYPNAAIRLQTDVNTNLDVQAQFLPNGGFIPLNAYPVSGINSAYQPLTSWDYQTGTNGGANNTTGITVTIKRRASGAQTYNVQFDFIILFKQTLILPSVFEPIRPVKSRWLVSLPVLGREGGVIQDLGSNETDLAISGGLFPTSQYTADQWWHVFDGLILEGGNIQADGNPTWQWLASDLVNGKFVLASWSPGQVMGRIAYHDYLLTLKRFDVIGETASMVGA